MKKNNYDIISISHFFYPIKGGLENMAYSLMTYFAKNGYKAIAVHGGMQKDKTYSENNFIIKAFKTKNIFNNAYPIFGIKFYKYIKQILKENENAKILIHSRHLISSFLSALACRSLKKEYILIEHTADTSYVKTKLAEISVKIYESTLSRYVVGRAKKIVSVSKASKNFLQKNYNVPITKIKVIHNGIDIDKIIKFKKNKKENIVVFAAKFIQVKDPETTYKAFKIVAKKFPNWDFYLIGNGEILKPKKEKNTNLKIINKMIEREQLLRLFGRSKIYINSSLSEALSLTIIESTLLGNIPILSNAPSNLEIAKELNTKTFVFQRQNYKDLAKKIELAIQNSKQKTLQKSITELTKKNFDNKTLLNKYLGLVKDLNDKVS